MKRALALALLAALPLLPACTTPTGDCIDGLEGQIRCSTTFFGTEICIDGDWENLTGCDAASGEVCTTCAATAPGGAAHVCAPCPAGGNSVARCALAAPVLTCP